MSDISIIFRRFPTERFKRFWYPSRPLMILALGFFFLVLGYTGVLSMSWSLWAAAAFAFDDLPMTPILAVATAFNNYLEGRKQFKAIMMLSAILLGLALGGALGWYAWVHMPMVVTVISNYIVMTGCSPLLISTAGILGGVVAHMTKKMPAIWGFILGITLAGWVPLPVPLFFEVLFISMVTSAFIASIVAKQGLRFYYRWQYGHSNADGYEMARQSSKQDSFVEKQAALFNVNAEQFRNLTNQCRERISEIKQKATFLEEMNQERQYKTNSYKDLYQVLMNPTLEKTEVEEPKRLIELTLRKPYDDNFKHRSAVAIMRMGGIFYHPNIETREMVHQFITTDRGDLSPHLLEPFLP